MQFASLTSIWFAIALPMIIIMYLLKKKYDDTPVSSHMLWQLVLKNMEANRPWQKLRNHALLYLQLLIAALLVIALMKPYVWTSATAKEHYIVLVDQSASMSAFMLDKNSADGDDSDLIISDESRFSRAIQEITAALSDRARGKMITLIGIGQQAEVLTLREPDRQSIAAAMATMTINYGRTAYEEALSLAAELAQDELAEVHLYTDGQFAAALDEFAWPSQPVVHLIGEDETYNASIMQFGVRRDGFASDTVTAVATFKNWGDQTLAGEAVLLNDDGYRYVQQLILMPNEQKTVYFTNQPLAKYYQLVMQVDDLLTADNEAFAMLTDEGAMRALLLTDGNMFLEKALQLSGVEIIKSQMNTEGRMVLPHHEVDMIVIDRVATDALATEEWQTLIATKPVWYIKYDLADYELIQPRLQYTTSDHPMLTYIDLHDMQLAEVQVFDSLEWGEVIASAHTYPLIYAGIVNGLPRVAYTFDLQRTDLPLRSEFPVLVSNTVQWLASAHAQNLGTAAAGDVLEMSLMTATADAFWQSVSDESLSYEVELVQGAVSYVQTIPRKPDLYRFVEKNEQGNIIQTRLLNVVMEQQESNLAQPFVPNADLINEDNELSQTQGEDDDMFSRSLIPWVIVLVLACVIIEWEVYRRGAAI